MKTTASLLLDLVFEGHTIRTIFRDGKPLFLAKDVAAACGISAHRDIVKTHVDPDQRVSSELDTLGGRQKVNFLTQSGVFALVMGSRKPAARRFLRWILDEVLPQLLSTGTYIPGSTPAERLQALHRRWRQERAACVATSEASLATSGLMTLQAFRAMHAIPVAEAPAIGRRLQQLARDRGVQPARLVLPGHDGAANAWPRPLLADAANSTPRPLF